MKMKTIRYITEDYLHGLKDSITGLMFIRRVIEEDAKEIKVDPPKPREAKTVLQMRREKQGIFRRPPEPPKKKDSIKKKLCQIYGLTIAFVVLWKIFCFVLSCLFGFLGNAEIGENIGFFAISIVFFGIKIIQLFWFSDVSGACMRALNFAPPRQSMGKMFGETVTSIIHANFFLVQVSISQYFPFPIIATPIIFIQTSLYNSISCFDYFFDSYHFSFRRRGNYFETRWPYFIGFGTPLTIAASLGGSWFANGVIYAILFPLFIISSYKVNWARKYEEPIPRIAFFRFSFFLTERVATMVRRITVFYQDPNRVYPWTVLFMFKCFNLIVRLISIIITNFALCVKFTSIFTLISVSIFVFNNVLVSNNM